MYHFIVCCKRPIPKLFTDLLLMRNNPCLHLLQPFWQAIVIFLFILNIFPLSAGFWAQGIWLHSQIPWLFTNFDSIKEFPWLLRKFRLFPDLENVSFFPNFSLTEATLRWQSWGFKRYRQLHQIFLPFEVVKSILKATFHGYDLSFNYLEKSSAFLTTDKTPENIHRQGPQ